MKRLTIRDLAKEVGLSPSGVSHALNNRPNIPEATRRRVREAAERLGYRPNALVQALMADLRNQSRSDKHLPMAYFSPFKEKVDQERWLYGAMEAEALSHGYHIDYLFDIGGSISPKRAIDVLAARSIKGVIVSPNLPIRVFPAQAFDQLAVGGFNYSEANETLHRATLDHSRDMDTTLDRIFAKGFKRPGLLIARKSDAVPRMHASGRFVARLWDRQLLQADSILRADEIPACRRELAGWLESHRPDVLIVADHPMLSLLGK
jgi:LacI family transcriptional regulator